MRYEPEDGSLRERKKALTRARIRSTALQLFVENGYERTTVDEICLAVPVAPRTFFRYFPSKEDVIASAAQETMLDVAEQLSQRPTSEPLPDAVVGAVVDAFAGDDEPRADVAAIHAVLRRTPSLHGRYLNELVTAEPLVAQVGRWLGITDTADPRVRSVTAAVVAALVVSFEGWLQRDGSALPDVLHESLRTLSSGLNAA